MIQFLTNVWRYIFIAPFLFHPFLCISMLPSESTQKQKQTIFSSRHLLRWDWNELGINDDTFLDRLSFPSSFIWGIADSAYQTEGPYCDDDRTIVNNWTHWQEQGRIKDNQMVGRACDRWNRWQDDCALIDHCGFRTYRFSIMWGKIEPEQGVFDDEALQHYIDIVDELNKRGIEPMICLWHFTWPDWFDELGRFEKPENSKYFIRFAEHIFDALHDKVKWWMTFNEPSAAAAGGYFIGNLPPGVKNNLTQTGIVLKNIFDTHCEIYNSFKTIDPEAQIGLCHVINPIYPYHQWNPVENGIADTFDTLFNQTTIDYFKTGVFDWRLPGYSMVYDQNDQAPSCLDWFGVNYYAHTNIKMSASLFNFIGEAVHEDEITTGNNQIIYPEGLYRAIKQCSELPVPLLVTENGLADNDDTLKQDFIRRHLYAVAQAIADGYDVRGYYYWTLLDNFEWDHGYNHKFGLFNVDPKTQERTLKSGSREFIDFLQQKKGN